MNKLTKDHLKERDELKERLDKAKSTLTDAIATYNHQLEEAKSPVETALDEYNSVLGEVNSFLEGLQDEAQSYFDGKSEKWKEGEKGEAYESWKEQFEPLDELEEIDFPEPLEDPDTLEEHIEKLAGLVESPSEM